MSSCIVKSRPSVFVHGIHVDSLPHEPSQFFEITIFSGAPEVIHPLTCEPAAAPPAFDLTALSVPSLQVAPRTVKPRQASAAPVSWPSRLFFCRHHSTPSCEDCIRSRKGKGGSLSRDSLDQRGTSTSTASS